MKAAVGRLKEKEPKDLIEIEDLNHVLLMYQTVNDHKERDVPNPE